MNSGIYMCTLINACSWSLGHVMYKKKIIIIRFATPFNTKSNLFQFYKHACRQNTCILYLLLINRHLWIRIKWNFSPCLLLLKFCKHISIAYITLAHAFIVYLRECWCLVFINLQHKISTLMPDDPQISGISRTILLFYFGKCVISLECLEIFYTSFQSFLSKH